MESQGRSGADFLIRKFLLLLLVYSGLRLLFLALHSELFAAQDLDALGAAFLRGARFDVSAIALSNAPVVLLALASSAVRSRSWYQSLMKGVFVGLNTFFICVMVADLEYFRFTGTRATFDLLYLDAEGWAQLGQLLVNHAPLALLAALLCFALFRLYPDAAGPPSSEPSASRHRGRTRVWSGAIASRLLIVGLLVLAARGGIQKKVLKPIHAFAGGDPQLGLLALNSTFTLLQSPLHPEVEAQDFFPSDADAEALLRAPFGYGGATFPDPPNVVLVILESFGTEFWGVANGGNGFTPFLDSLAGEGLFLASNFANGRRSIDALPSILLGVPSLGARSIAQSGFQGNQWVGLGHLLGQYGFHTSFFHGAPKGTMYFDAIASMSGIHAFHPLEAYPEERRDEDFDGHWGLWDEPFLQFVAERLAEQPTPFFSTIFTISSHQPYQIPERYRDRLPEEEMPIQRSIRYVDAAVESFFRSIEDETWYDDTLFILTGDHTQANRSTEYDTFLGRYMVPLLLFHPGGRLPEVDPQRITQHVDLFHTILDVAGVEPERIPRFGRSVFSSSPGEAVLQSNGHFWLVRREGVIQRDPGGQELLFAFREHRTEALPIDGPSGLHAVLRVQLHAHLQHFSNSLIRNAFYRDSSRGRAVPLAER